MVIAYDTNKLFYSKIVTGKDTLLINRRMFGFLNTDSSIGMKDGKIDIKYKNVNGYVHGICPDISMFPIDKIKNYIDDNIVNLIPIANIAKIRDAIGKLLPIFSGEKSSIINLVNKNKKLKVIAESALNGRATVEIVSDTNALMDINVDTNYLKNIPFDYNLHLNNSGNLVCDNENGSYIIYKL
jgi:hypothetical protein